MADGSGGPRIEVIATTISGSIRDWGKVKRIVPLFADHGYRDVGLHEADSHAGARAATRARVAGGARIVISAGGSGTFNAVLEGCCDSGVPPGEITLGFLRKGSADLIGKVLGMPDDIEAAIAVFAKSIADGRTVKCDILHAEDGRQGSPARHFVGYAGAEIFGGIPTVTENPLTKYYKGVLSQLFGDLGPFFVGATLSSAAKVARSAFVRRRRWTVTVDGREAGRGRYQAFIIVNGDLGDDLPLARGVPLGSGDFHLFALRDLGFLRLPGQFRETWRATILGNPEKWGMEHSRVTRELLLREEDGGAFRANVDGSTMRCAGSARFGIGGHIRLIAGGGAGKADSGLL